MALNSARVLIVGCGYLGKRVAHSLSRQGAEVFAVTRSPDRAAEFRRFGWNPIVADVLNPEPLASGPTFDAVLYAVGYDRSSGVARRAVSVEGLERTLQAISGRTGRLVFISSSSVYGQSDGEIVDENSVTQPATESGLVCLEAEQAVWNWRDLNPEGLAVSILRLTGIYGPGRLLAKAETLRAGEPLSGRGDAWLNLIHGDDAAALAQAALSGGRDRAVYLGVDSEPVQRAEYYGRLAELLGAPVPQFSGEPREASRGSERGLNKRCTNPMTRHELAVPLAFPTFREGLADSLVRE